MRREWWWWLRHSSCCPTRIRVANCDPYVCYTSSSCCPPTGALVCRRRLRRLRRRSARSFRSHQRFPPHTARSHVPRKGGKIFRLFGRRSVGREWWNGCAIAAAAHLWARWCAALGRLRRFNPHPPVGGGCNFNKRSPCTARSSVSILTRPLGRVQPWRSRPVRHTPFRFNPHPPVGAGATHIHSIPHPQAARTRVANLRQYGLFTHAVQGRNIPRAWRNNS